MAQRIIERLSDDLDGGDAAETVSFGLDAKTLEIDLSEANAAKLREALAPYVAAARRVGGSGPRRQSTAAVPKRSRDDLASVRTWLGEHGYPVKNRGRISDAWLADFDTKSPNPPQQDARAEKKPKRKMAKVKAPVFQAV